MNSFDRVRDMAPMRVLGALLVTVMLSGVVSIAQAQISTTDLASGPTATDLANALVGTGVTVSGVTYTGDNSAAGTFSGGTGIVGFEDGIILSSGMVDDVVGPNASSGTTTAHGTAGDGDLDAIATGTTEDAAVLEFDFVPTGSQVSFRYVFGSEEYNEFTNGSVNDIFAFFINGTNYALLPDNVTVVSINTVNGGNPDECINTIDDDSDTLTDAADPDCTTPSDNIVGENNSNSAFFRNNACDDPDGGPACPIDIETDGLTVVLALTAPVNPSVTNTMKIAIADVSDSSLDSWVFIEGGSLSVDVCGDGVVTAGEECDDGGVIPGDGCDATCQLEPTAPPSPCVSAEVSSTFDADLEGWTVSGAASGFAWQAAGGNPAGYAEATPSAGGATLAEAPAAFLGSWLTYDGVGQVSFDHKIFSHNGTILPSFVITIYNGATDRARFNFPHPQAGSGSPTDWVPVTAPIAESGWTVELGTWANLMTNVTRMTITIEMASDADTVDVEGIDNVVLCATGAVCGNTLVEPPAEQCDAGPGVEICDTPDDEDNDGLIGCEDIDDCCANNGVTCSATCQLGELCQLIQRDPQVIKFKDGQPDFLKLHGRVEISEGYDATAQQFTITLSNATGVIYRSDVDGSALTARPGKRWRYSNAAARTSQGVSKINSRLRKDQGKTFYSFKVKAHGDFSAATLADMTTQIFGVEGVGIVQATWRQRRNGWVLYQKDVGARGLKTFCENTECNDGLLNQDETDVDCGGSICQACPLGSTCTIDGDCISDLCAAGVCSSATTTTTLTPLIRRVFVTSSTTDGALGGLAGADAFCQGLADSAVLGGTWTAWLSTSSPSVDAKDRIPDAQYQLVDGTVIANSKADLTDGSLLAPISRDETGAVPAGQVIVWTGTLADGTEASSTSNCMGWTSNAFPNNDGLRGDMTSVTGQWTDLGVVETCTVVHRIYCFEQ